MLQHLREKSFMERQIRKYLIILFLIDCYQNRHYKDANAALCFRIFPSTVRWIVYLILGIFIVFFFILQNGIFGQMGQFIYFQF